MFHDILRRAADVVRGQDWWFYKIPPLLAAGYATTILFPLAPSRTFVVLGAVLLSICMVASFGYVINDLFDIEQDRRSGRRNRAASLAQGRRVLLCVVPVVAAFGALRAADAPPLAFGLLALNLLLPALYSVPPIRLKERGVLGVIADAGAAHLLPTALMVTALTPHALPRDSGWWMFLVATCGWAWFAGLRGIIVHQVSDQRADAAAGIETFGGRLGPARARALTFRVLAPLEVGALLVFFWRVVPSAPALAVVVLLYAACEIQKIRSGWKLPLFEPPAESQERYIPLLNNELYELWLPLGLAVQLAWVRPAFLVLFAFQLIAFWPNLRARAGVLRQLMFPTPAPRT